MQKYNGQLIRQFASSITGNAASGVTVTVRRQSDAGLATLYVENNIAGATLSNPITTTSTGHFAFYAADDVYTLTFSDSTPVQVIQLQDVAELQAQFDAAVLNAGYIPSGTFAAGATLTQANQVLSDGSSYWRWDGGFPKVVTAGSEPTPTGVGNWIVLSDFALRGDLADAESTVLIAGVQARAFRAIDGVKNLVPVENVMLNVMSFYAGGNTGGGDFMYVPTMPKSNHNGGTVIAPEALAAWNGTGAGIATLINWTGTGNGCYVRKYTLKGYIPCSFFGASTAIPDNRLPVQKCLTAATAQSKIAFLEPSPDFYMFNLTVFIPSGGHLAGAGGKNKLTKCKRVDGHYTDLFMSGVHTEGTNGSYYDMVIPARNGMPHNPLSIGNDVKITGLYIDGNGINAGYAPELGSGTGYKGSNIYIRFVDGLTIDDLYSEYASNDCCYAQYCRRISVTNTKVARNKLTGNVIGFDSVAPAILLST